MFEIEIKKDKTKNLYTQIYEAIREEILANNYTPDTKLPSIRKLASRLKVNNETIVKAYNLLASENLIYKKEGSGSYIAPAPALTNNKEDQRLKILSSKKFLAPKKDLDFRGLENGVETLAKYGWNSIFEKYYKIYGGEIFKNKKLNQKNKYLQFLKEKNNSIETNQLYYCSENQKKDIAKKLIDFNKDLLFLQANNNSFFFELYQEVCGYSFKNRDLFLIKKDNINLVASNYKKIINFLNNNPIDYLFISDESLAESVLDWDFVQIKNLLKLAQKLDFKIVIQQYFELYQENKKIKKILKTKYRKNIILIQALTNRVFPGLKMGIFYLETKPEESFSIFKKYNLAKIIKKTNLTAGENLVNNLLDYYLEHDYLNRRIKFLKQRLKNRNLILQSELKNQFKKIDFINNNLPFYFQIKLETKINQEKFKKFAKDNSILVPDYKHFMTDQKSNKLIISTASLNQFFLKQAAFFLTKICQEFVNLS